MPGMTNPLRALRDWSRTKQAAAELAAAVRRARPGGVDVSREDPELAAAVMYLLKHHSETYIVVKQKKNRTLAFKADMRPSLSTSLYTAMDDAGLIAKPGEDLVNE